MSEPERIRVAFCIDNMDVGGTELNALRTAEQLDRDRFELMVIALRTDGPLLARYQAIGVRVIHFPIAGLASLRTARRAVHLARLLRRERIDILHCHDRYSDFFGAVSARLARTPVVIASKRWGETTRRHWLTSAIAFRLAHRVLANSAGVAESLRTVDRISETRIIVVPNFLEDECYEPVERAVTDCWRRELEIPPEGRVIGIIASLRPVKDHATLFRAFAELRVRHPDAWLVVVGEGGSRGALGELATSLGIADHVRFAGLRPRTPSMHHLFDVAVLCSRSEGFPNSLVEAMAARRPIVATDVVGIRDAVRHGENGLLVPTGDAPAMARALDELLSNVELATRLGAGGFRLAREEYHVRRVIGRLEELYAGLLREAR